MKFSQVISTAAIAMAETSAAASLRVRQTGLPVITSVTAEGDGCPTGSFVSTVSVNGREAVGGYSDFVATSETSNTLLCLVKVSLKLPLGCTAVSIKSVARGFADVQSGASGTLRQQYSLSAPGLTTGANPPTVTFPTGGADFSHSDIASKNVDVASAAQQNVDFFVKTTINAAAQTSGAKAAVAVDSLAVALTVGSC